jgi:hypothetical protein
MDVDIDMADRSQLLYMIDHIPATIVRNGEWVRHNSGIYFQNIPFNPAIGSASIDHKTAHERGYFKIDLLNVSAYQGIKSEHHLVTVLNQEPVWELLEEPEICQQLFHLNGYHGMIQLLKPRSVDQLAAVLALIRPAKRHLVEKCKTQGFDAIQSELWSKSQDGSYQFKRSHSLGYASLIVTQLNLICEQASQ